LGVRVLKPHRLPINIFDTTGVSEGPNPWLERFRFMADVLDKIYPGVGPVQRQLFKQSVRQAFDAARARGKMPTIYDVHAAYRDSMPRADSIFAILDDLVDMEVFAADPGDGDSFDLLLDGVAVVALGDLGQDDRSKNMLVAVFLNLFYEHMLRLPKRPYAGVDPQLRVIDSFLLVDEADNIMRYEFDVLRKVLLQGREFGVGVILASQYLSHFKASATDYRQPLLTWMIHKVPNVTAQELGSLGSTGDLAQLAERVKALPNHEFLYKTHDSSGLVVKGFPFFRAIGGVHH
jgi:DNA phosphorothioation-dependent restriction protein DptH